MNSDIPTTNPELKGLGTDVKAQGEGNGLTDLVFDPETGTFRTVAKGTHPESGEIVTRMTEEGFAGA